MSRDVIEWMEPKKEQGGEDLIYIYNDHSTCFEKAYVGGKSIMMSQRAFLEFTKFHSTRVTHNTSPVYKM